MKRHESLAPLSREHHGALLLAQLLKKNAPDYKGMPTSVPGKVEYALRFFNDSLKGHFDKEELLFQKIQHCHDGIQKLVSEIVDEHRQLTALFESLEKSADPGKSLDELGNLLDLHIRKEERVLFPLIQQHCPEALLNEVGLLLI
jgi:iron-sulfur cluster repair protein YtfE (RIC family)